MPDQNQNYGQAESANPNHEKPTDIIKRDLPSEINRLNHELAPLSSGSNRYLPPTDTVAVSIVDLSAKDRGTMNYNGDTQFTAASTYKLIVAVSMIRDVETSISSWNSPLNGVTLRECLHEMISFSDNNCPAAYIEKFGDKKLNSIAHNYIGMSGITHFAPQDKRTCAKDLALLLQKLYSGDLISEENRALLLNELMSQRYREGIPSGIQNANVADKVGFLGTLKHDASIILSEHGDYILVIMTKGETTAAPDCKGCEQDWRFIGDLAQWIDAKMNSALS